MIRKLLSFLLLLPIAAFAGQVTGQLQTPTGGAVANGTLTFSLSQSAILSGTASIVPSTVSCYTSSTGSVVGLPDPLTTPITATNTGSGTLAAGTYYVKIAYTGTPGDSIASPEATVVLSSTGTVIVNAPTVQPASATGYKVYIGSTSGSETLQGTVTGWTNYSQSAALSAGAAPPATNASVCTIRFSDELIPTGTYYTVNLLNKNGSQYAGYPQTWCTYGGSGGTINVSSGAPTGTCGTTGVYYPTPIYGSVVTPQSVGGPLSATEFDGPLVGPVTGNVLGNLTGNSNGTHTGAVVGTTVSATCSQISAIKDVRCYSGATSDIQLNAAIAALPANGGIVDARGYGSTAQTIAATVEIGSNTAPGKTVTLLLDPTTKFTCTITNGTPCWIRDAGSFIVADAATVAVPNAGFTVSATANVSNILLMRDNQVANLVGGSVSGISIFGVTGAIVSDALLGIQNALQITQIRNVTVAGQGVQNAVLLKIYGTAGVNTGNIDLDNVQIDGAGATGVRPVWIGCTTSGSLTPVACTAGGIAFLGVSALTHPGTGLPIVTIEAQNGAGGVNAIGNIGFYGTQIESMSATDIGWLVDGAESVHIYGAYASCRTTCGADIVKLAQPAGTSLDGIDIRNLDNQGGWTNTLNNTVLTSTFPDATYPRLNYTYAATGHIADVHENGAMLFGKGSGISADGAGFKHKVFGATTATAAVANATATTTLTWTTAFADTNYTPVCTPAGTITGTPIWQGVTAKTTTGVTVQVMAATAAASSFGAVNCIATHQ